MGVVKGMGMFHLSPPEIEQFLTRLHLDAADTNPLPEGRFNELMQQAYLVVALHETEGFTAEGLLKCPGIGVGHMRRYCKGISRPHHLMYRHVLLPVARYCADAYQAYRERERASSEAMQAFNLAIQAPGFDGTSFLRDATEEGFGTAMARAVAGEFTPEES